MRDKHEFFFVVLMLIFHSIMKLNSSYAEFIEPTFETEERKRENEKLRIVELPRTEKKIEFQFNWFLLPCH